MSRRSRPKSEDTIKIETPTPALPPQDAPIVTPLPNLSGLGGTSTTGSCCQDACDGPDETTPAPYTDATSTEGGPSDSIGLYGCIRCVRGSVFDGPITPPSGDAVEAYLAFWQTNPAYVVDFNDWIPAATMQPTDAYTTVRDAHRVLASNKALGYHVVIVRPKDATQHSIQTVEGGAYGSPPQAIGRVAAAAKKTSYGIVVHLLLQTDDATGYGNERTLGRLVAMQQGRVPDAEPSLTGDKMARKFGIAPDTESPWAAAAGAPVRPPLPSGGPPWSPALQTTVRYALRLASENCPCEA